MFLSELLRCYLRFASQNILFTFSKQNYFLSFRFLSSFCILPLKYWIKLISRKIRKSWKPAAERYSQWIITSTRDYWNSIYEGENLMEHNRMLQLNSSLHPRTGFRFEYRIKVAALNTKNLLFNKDRWRDKRPWTKKIEQHFYQTWQRNIPGI